METLPNHVREIAMGCYLCVICDVFTDHPEQHLHEHPAGGN